MMGVTRDEAVAALLGLFDLAQDDQPADPFRLAVLMPRAQGEGAHGEAGGPRRRPCVYAVLKHLQALGLAEHRREDGGWRLTMRGLAVGTALALHPNLRTKRAAA
ncbi:MAG: hypothetical protein ACFCGT_24255 [Sandaracinaceae bacterium]